MLVGWWRERHRRRIDLARMWERQHPPFDLPRGVPSRPGPARRSHGDDPPTTRQNGGETSGARANLLAALWRSRDHRALPPEDECAEPRPAQEAVARFALVVAMSASTR